MNDKFLAWEFGTAIMGVCCIGVPLLLGFLGTAGVFAWLSDNALAGFALFLLAVATYLFHRDRKKRRPRSDGREP